MHIRNCISLLIVVMFCDTGFAQTTTTAQPTTTTPRPTTTAQPTTTTKQPTTIITRRPTTTYKVGWDDEEPYEVDTVYSKNRYGYGNKPYNNDNDGYGPSKNSYKDNDDDDDYKYGSSKYAPSRQKREPDEYGNMNIYFREPSYSGKARKPKRLRFPVHRFKKGHFPPLPPLISFLPWLPIFADKFTKQTIIFSPTGGLYIIPPVINIFGQMFSVAQLIASGYCSLVSSGVPPPPAVNVAPLVAPGAVTGPGIPPPDKTTGGFKGGVQTQFSSFPKTNYGGKGGY